MRANDSLHRNPFTVKSVSRPITTLMLVGAVVLAFGALSGCATRSNSAEVYRAGESQVERSFRTGIVESVRGVTIQRDSRGVGVVAGGVVGGIAGSSIGEGRGSGIASVLGAVGGAVAGQAIEDRMNQRAGFEIVVRFDSGEKRAIVQEADVSVRPGDRVRVIGSGSSVRVAPY